MKLLSIIFAAFISILSFADSDLERLKYYCHSSISLDDFIKKNKIIIRVKNSSPGVNIIDSLVGIYPTNFNLEVRDKENEILLESVKYDLHHIYWGHPEKLLKDNILRIDPQNCIFVSKTPNLLEEITKRMDINDLDHAASMYNFSLAEKLIKEKKFQNKKGEYSWSALSILAREREDLALAMLENGFPIEKDEWRSALVTAVSSSNLALAKKTISLNANVNYTYKNNGITPLLIAVMNSDIPMVRLLLENGANPKPIPPFNHNPICFINGYDNITGKKLLSLVKNSEELTQVLLSKGADPNAKCGNNSSITPLSYLSKSEYAKVVDLLLNHGATPIDYHPQAHIPIPIAQLLKRRGHKITSLQDKELKKYEEIKSSFVSKKSPNDDEVISAVKNAIYFNDHKLFSEAIKLVKTESLFRIKESSPDIANRCITHLLTNADQEFFKGLQDRGISLTARCGSQYFFKSLIESFIESCRYDLIELIPDEALLSETLSRENIDNFFSDMGSTADFRLNCLKTISNL